MSYSITYKTIDKVEDMLENLKKINLQDVCWASQRLCKPSKKYRCDQGHSSLGNNKNTPKTNRHTKQRGNIAGTLPLY
jgi:hypothetical protein